MCTLEKNYHNKLILSYSYYNQQHFEQKEKVLFQTKRFVPFFPKERSNRHLNPLILP